MKIVTFFDSLKIGGGVEKVQAITGTMLQRQGHEVIYLLLEDKVPRNEFEGKIHVLNEKFIYGFGLRKIYSLFHLAKRVSNFCKNQEINVILGQGDFFYMVVAISKIFYGNPSRTIGVVHTTIGIWNYFIRQTLIFLLKKLDYIVLISHEEKKTFINKYGFLEKKCSVIYNSLDLQIFEEKKKIPLEEKFMYLFSPKKFTYINIGRLSYQKNQSLLLDAFEIVHKSYPNTQLLILGQGELENELEKKRKMLLSSHEIHFLGNQENIYPFLMESNCFVLSSRFEGFPMVFLEVIFSGNLPIISTSCPTGPSEILSEEYLSPIYSSQDLAKNMIEILIKDSYRNKNINFLKSKKHLFHPDVIAGEWANLFDI